MSLALSSLSVPSGEQASGRRWDCSGLGHVARRCFGTKWYTVKCRGHGVPEMVTPPECASAPNGTVKCRGHGVPDMVTPASRTTAVLLVCLIIITLRRAQKFGDMYTGPYKNFDFLVFLDFLDFLVTPASRTTAVGRQQFCSFV